jgi:hypothetical protein
MRSRAVGYRKGARGGAGLLMALVLLLPLTGLTALEVELQSPLTTVVRCPAPVPGGDLVIRAVVVVPGGAPGDLGVGAFVSDRHGRWFQQFRPGTLSPGRHPLSIQVNADESFLSEPDHASWNESAARLTAQAGLFFWSASGSHAGLRVEGLTAVAAADLASLGLAGNAEARTSAGALCDLRLDGYDAAAGVANGRTGERWTLSLDPRPFPVNPYDPRQFALDAVFTTPDGHELNIAGFVRQPMRLTDRGDREDASPDGPARFEVRFRPRLPGRYMVRLEARWQGDGQVLRIELPDLEVAGPAWDGYARVDHGDPRFFTVDGHFYWPIGLNLNSTYDTRCRDRLGTVLTPPRGTFAYLPRLSRLAAAGGDLVEIWMASWNMSLEWRGDWPGYFGTGRYNEGNAARLDTILDAAWDKGIRVNLVLNNHGTASPSLDREWKDNPWNRVNGGPLEEPYELFTSPLSLDGQERVRRYIIARYADHPAVFGWKLWSEINLTAVGESQRQKPRTDVPLASNEERHATLVHWHEHAAARWHALDVYGHGVTTHWSGDYHRPERDVVALPGLDYVCIDAYLNQRSNGQGESLADLIYNGTQDPDAGLGKFGKPLLVTEYGATWQAGTKDELEAELASAAWAGMVSGNGGAPMLWWFEWVDQGERWKSYGAIRRFLVGEDLRGAKAHAAVLGATSPAGTVWARAWARPGHMLGYLADVSWACTGTNHVTHDASELFIGDQVSAGKLQLEWWDADLGQLLKAVTVDHLGGTLMLKPPPFTHHVAFKLKRDASP